MSELYLPTNDYVFKHVFSQRQDALADFLRSILKPPLCDFTSLTLSPVDLAVATPGQRRGVLDIKLTTSRNDIVDVEMQVYRQQGIFKRAVWYAAGMYWEQPFQEKNAFHKLNSVVSVFLLDYLLFPQDKAPLHHYSLYDVAHGRELEGNPLSLYFVEIPKADAANGALQAWLQFFRCKTKEEFMSLAAIYPAMDEAWEEVRKLNLDPEQREHARSYEIALRDMLGYMETAHEEGKAQGRAEGKAEGRAEGKAEGKAEGVAEGLKSVAANMLHANEPRAKIMAFTGLSEQDLDDLEKTL